MDLTSFTFNPPPLLPNLINHERVTRACGGAIEQTSVITACYLNIVPLRPSEEQEEEEERKQVEEKQEEQVEEEEEVVSGQQLLHLCPLRSGKETGGGVEEWRGR